MDHATKIRDRRRPRPRATVLALIMGAALVLLALPAVAGAAPRQIEPVDGHHFDHLERAPMLIFDPGVDAQPKWILLATDAGMATTVRYCRQFVWAATQNGNMAWGCNKWATGVDSFQQDTLLALEPGKTYYWQVVAKKSPTDETEVKSEIRSFTLDPEKQDTSIADISDQIMGSTFDDGSQLNLGAAAFVNSKVKVGMPTAKRKALYAFQLKVKVSGTIDITRSYVQIKSAAGTRYIKVAKIQGGVQGLWKMSAAEKRLKTKRFQYQVYVKSATNGSLVRSRYSVLVVKGSSSSSSTVSVPTQTASPVV